MPRIPTHQRQISKSTNVGAAIQPFVDTDAGAIGRGLANFGQGLGNLGQAIFKIRQEQIKLNDSINISKINALQQTSQESLAILNSQTNLTFDKTTGKSSWEVNGELSWQEFKEASKGLSLLSLNKQQLLDAQMEIWQLQRGSKLRTSQSISLIKEAQSALPLGVEEAARTGGDLDIAIKNFNDSKESAWGARDDLADAALKKAMRDGVFQRIQNEIGVNPEGALEQLKAELAARKDGKTTNELWKRALPDNEDISDLSREARGVIANRKNDLNEQQEKERDKINKLTFGYGEEEQDFVKAGIEIENSSLDEKEQRSLLKQNLEFQIALAKGGKDPAQVKNASDLTADIWVDPAKHTAEFLSKQEKDGTIHAGDLSNLNSIREKVIRQRTKNPAAANGMQLLKDLHNKKSRFGKGLKGADLYNRVVEEYNSFLLGGEKERTAKEVGDYIDNVLGQTGEFTLGEFFVGAAKGKGVTRKTLSLERRLGERLDAKVQKVIDSPSFDPDPAREPTTKEEFEAVSNSISDFETRKAYVDRWIGKFFK